jgi:hypothetical protein
MEKTKEIDQLFLFAFECVYFTMYACRLLMRVCVRASVAPTPVVIGTGFEAFKKMIALMHLNASN